MKNNPYLVLAVCGFLLLAVALVFGQTLRHDFVNYDDDAYVYENPQVRAGLSLHGVAWAFASTYQSNWHPLTWISHMLDCQLYRLDPWGHHLSNVLLHAATAILLFLVLRQMTGDLWPSGFAAALFAVHPLHVESVAWVAERKDVLSGFCFMLTLAAYVAYARRPFSLARYLAVVACFALGLMAKPMLVTLPFVLLLLDYWPLQRWRAGGIRLWVEKLPLVALAAAACVVTLAAHVPAMQSLEQVPIAARMANAAVACVAYLGQFFYPAGLAVLYPHPGDTLPAWKVLGALLVLAGISAAVLAGRRRVPCLLVGWLWYLGMLVPVIGLVQVGRQAMADRYTYLPEIGLSIALAWGVASAVRSWPYSRWLCGVGSLLVLAVLMGCAWRQTSYWRNSKAMWEHTLDCTSANYIAEYNLGNTLAGLGRYAEAIDRYHKALAIQPDCAEAHYNLGVALERQGKMLDAVDCWREAVRLQPDHLMMLRGLAWTLATSPDRRVRNGREAVALAQRAVELSGGRDPASLDILAAAYAESGQFSEAAQTAECAIRLASAQRYGSLAHAIRGRLKLYEAGVPFHRTPTPPRFGATPP